jgi:hypothetical protein
MPVPWRRFRRRYAQLVGDERQLQPIEAGAPFKVLQQELAGATLSNITRQYEEQLAAFFAEGICDGPIKDYNGLVESGAIPGHTSIELEVPP